jgi:hypothetical protein
MIDVSPDGASDLAEKTSAMAVTQQEQVDQLQALQGQMQGVKRLLAAPKAAIRLIPPALVGSWEWPPLPLFCANAPPPCVSTTVLAMGKSSGCPR